MVNRTSSFTSRLIKVCLFVLLSKSPSYFIVFLLSFVIGYEALSLTVIHMFWLTNTHRLFNKLMLAAPNILFLSQLNYTPDQRPHLPQVESHL